MNLRFQPNVIIRNYASNLISLAQLVGKPATAGQKDDIPKAITRNTSVYHMLN